jgi:putative transposase
MLDDSSAMCKYRSIKMGRRPKQLALEFRTWGGKRAKAGRKRTSGGRPCVPHRMRGVHRAAHPVHVTLRARAGLPPFRELGIFAEMRAAIRKANHSPAVGEAFRVVEFSVQRDHVHLVVEAHDADVLSRGVRGLAIRLARAVNRALGVRGQVWGDRFHSRDLKTPRAVRNALVYVLMNAKKHGARLASGVDAFSSAPWFAGFAARSATSHEERPVALSRTWLGGLGWRRRGLVRFDERPAAPD